MAVKIGINPPANILGGYEGRLLERDLDAELEALQPHIERVRTGGATLIYKEATHAIDRTTDPLSDRPHIDEAAWPRYCERLTAFSQMLAQHGVETLYYPHLGTVIQTQTEIERLMCGTENIGLVLDTGHMFLTGGSPLSLLENFPQRIKQIRLKACDAEKLPLFQSANWSYPYCQKNRLFVIPPRGLGDFKRLFEALRLIHYEGWLIVEAEPAVTREAYEYLNEVFQSSTVPEMALC